MVEVSYGYCGDQRSPSVLPVLPGLPGRPISRPAPMDDSRPKAGGPARISRPGVRSRKSVAGRQAVIEGNGRGELAPEGACVPSQGEVTRSRAAPATAAVAAAMARGRTWRVPHVPCTPG